MIEGDIDNKKPKVSVVTVTFNRLEKLKHTLDCFDNQTASFDNLIVVDNYSSDGTKEFLEQWILQKSSFTKHVISLDRNTGGSGGFYEGEKYAVDLSSDWVYVADDDAYPDKNMVEKFYEFYNHHSSETISAICSVVLFPDKSINAGCRGCYRIMNNEYAYYPASQYDKSFFEINSFSYVGAFISAKALQSKGYVNKDYFIYQDDREHSIRLGQYGKMYCVTNIVVTHDEPRRTVYQAGAIWKEYYAYRNFSSMLLEHFPKAGRKNILRELINTNIRKSSSFSPIQKMKLEGIKDALVGRLGTHKIYKPGLDCSDYTKLPYPRIIWGILYPVFRLYKVISKLWI